MKFSTYFIIFIFSNTLFAGGWIQKADFPADARHRTVGIAISNKAYVGLGHYNGAGINVLFNDWWEYDPSTNSWTQKADYLGGLCYDAVGFTIDNFGYVGTGRTSSVGSILVQDFFKYNPITNSWVAIAPFTGTGRRGAVSFVINEKAYVGTGETNLGRVKSFYKYDPNIDSWTQIADMAGNSRTASVGFSIGNYGYVGTGDLFSGPSNDFWQYNPNTDSWIQKSNVGPLMRQEATGFELEGKGYILTGQNNDLGINYSDMWEYNPNSDLWSKISDFQGTARRYLTSIVLSNDVYVGLGTNGVNFCDWWIYDKYLSTLEQNIEQNKIKVYPNPTSNFIICDFNFNGDFEIENTYIELTNSSGKLVKRKKINQSQTKIEVNDLPPGTYHYHLNYKNYNLRRKKLIITK